MTKEELAVFYQKLAALTETGTEADVRAYIDQQLPRLPEDVRNEVIFSSLFSAIEEEAQEEAAIAEIQDQGLAAADSLEKAREEIQKEATPLDT